MFGKIMTAVCALILLSGCGEDQKEAQNGVAEKQQTFKWKMVTSWPKNYPGLGTAPEMFADMVDKMSAGRLKVKVYGAGELVPALEVFDAVSQGTAEMGHAGPYYWKGKVPASPFFSAVPFGLNAQEMNGWIYYGGGLELWRKAYEPFNLIPFPGGRTGVQMAGWFNKEINSVEDLTSLKTRIPGIGGEVLARIGGQTMTISGGELYTSMQTNVVDAVEWVGPYNDLAFGFYQIAKYYYYPGWQEPGSLLEFTVNKDAYDALPKDLQAIVEVAAKAVNEDTLALYTARNKDALKELVDQHGVQLRELPEEVTDRLREATEVVLEEMAATDPLTAEIYESQKAFKQGVMAYHRISEEAAYRVRREEE